MKNNLAVQPNIVALIERAQENLGTEATVLFHRSGQILAKNGSIPEHDYPTVAVLVAGMVAAGHSLAQLCGESENRDYQLSHGNTEAGIYAVRINQDFWVFSLYKQVMNPGLFRMQMRRLAEEISIHLESPKAWVENQLFMSPEPRAKTAPEDKSGPRLFADISDAEIDELFHT